MGKRGPPPSGQAVMQARDVLSRLLVERPNVPKPERCPTEQGGIRAEWLIGNWHSEIKFTGKDEPGTLGLPQRQLNGWARCLIHWGRSGA